MEFMTKDLKVVFDSKSCRVLKTQKLMPANSYRTHLVSNSLRFRMNLLLAPESKRATKKAQFVDSQRIVRANERVWRKGWN